MHAAEPLVPDVRNLVEVAVAADRLIVIVQRRNGLSASVGNRSQ
jgi:hypothetical protein